MKSFRLPHLPFLHWLAGLIPILILLCWANFESQQMQGILPNYIDFAHFFREGYSYTFQTPSTTFPMWGYGLILTTAWPKWLIIVLQQCLNLGFLLYLDRLWISWGFSKTIQNRFRWAVWLAWPWHLMHSVLWPYSIGAIGISLAVIFIIQLYRSNQIKWAILSALSFGITLQFRSDYQSFFMLIGVFTAVYFAWKRKSWKGTVVLGFGLACMIPWLQYSHHRTGHYLMTSTNAGHPLFCGLGQLPNNVWHISPVDEDSTMQAIAHPYGGTLTYSGDSILKIAWKDSVMAHPFELVKKSAYVAISRLAPRPFNGGDMMHEPIHKNVEYYVRYFLTGTTIILGFLWFWLGIWGMIGIIRSKKYTTFHIGSWAIIVFQWALILGAYFMPPYHTNIWWFYSFFVLTIGLSTKEQESQQD
jgi:hypothetical protein